MKWCDWAEVYNGGMEEVAVWEPTDIQAQLAELYAIGHSWSAAGRQLGLTRSTLNHWLWEAGAPPLKAFGEQRRAEVMAAALPKYTALIDKAHDVLLRVADGELDADSPRARWAERYLARTFQPVALVSGLIQAGLAVDSRNAWQYARIVGIQDKHGRPADPD